jgi:hypothetical protein
MQMEARLLLSVSKALTLFGFSLALLTNSLFAQNNSNELAPPDKRLDSAQTIGFIY